MSMVYVWLAVTLLAVIAEAMTAQLVAVWFAPAALIALFLAVIGSPVWLQAAVFIAVSVVLILLLYRKLHDNIAKTSEKTNLDAIVGADVKVEEDIPADGFGRVNVKGVSWKAVCDRPAKAGEHVKVESIDGVTLVCRAAE